MWSLIGSFTRLAFQGAKSFRTEFWMRIVGVLLAMYGVFWLWHALYARSSLAFSVSLEQMITYATLSILLREILATDAEWYIAGQVRTGAIESDLLRPVDFHVYLLARSQGEVIVSFLVVALPSAALGVGIFGIGTSVTLTGFLQFLLSMELGFLVQFHLGFLFGLISFFTMDIRNIAWAYYATTAFLSGMIVPLWVFPGFLQDIAGVLPFRAIYFIPLSIYTNVFAENEGWSAIAFQIVWTMILLALVRIVWGRIAYRLSIQGG